MRLINSWASHRKDASKIDIKIRLGFITILELKYNTPLKQWRVGLFNFALVN
jgi:hypothetical protein